MVLKETIIAGVDIGGSHITAALLNIETREVLQETVIRKSVSSNQSAPVLINEWASVIKESYHIAGLEPYKAGIAFPGPFDYNKGICLITEQEKFRNLYGLNIGDLLSSKLNIPAQNILFRNDAACFLQGEIFAGNVNNDAGLAGITLGTGLGAAVYNGEKVSDADLWNYPFKNGIAEDYLSAGGILRMYKNQTGKTIANVKEIVDEYAVNKDSCIKEIFCRFGKLTGEFVEILYHQKKINKIIFGGNISKAWELFAPCLKTYLKENNIPVIIHPTTLGEMAVLTGAVGFLCSFANK